MATATQHPPHSDYGVPGATHAPEPIDPERDIDARSTTLWVSASALVLFVSLYFMLPLFDRVLRTERDKKIANLPAVEKDQLFAGERAYLNGETSPSKKSIEQVMREMVQK